MPLTPEQKEHAIDLIEMGDKLEAVRYFQDTLNLSAEDALVLAEKLEEEIEGNNVAEIKAMHDQIRKQPTLDVGRVVGIIFMSIGSIMLAVVIYLVTSNYKFMQRAIPVQGKVIDYQSYESRDDDGRYTTMFTPIYQYAFKGKSYTHISTTSTSSKDYLIDDAVEILVDPQDPKEIVINSFMEKWFLSILFGFMGTLFSGLGFMAYRLLGNKR